MGRGAGAGGRPGACGPLSLTLVPVEAFDQRGGQGLVGDLTGI